MRCCSRSSQSRTRRLRSRPRRRSDFSARSLRKDRPRRRKICCRCLRATSIDARASQSWNPTSPSTFPRFAPPLSRSATAIALSGVKGLVPLAGSCSHFLVVARCDDTLDAFIVERNARGVSVGEKKPNIGLRALEMATVSFKDVELAGQRAARRRRGMRCATHHRFGAHCVVRDHDRRPAGP